VAGPAPRGRGRAAPALVTPNDLNGPPVVLGLVVVAGPLYASASSEEVWRGSPNTVRIAPSCPRAPARRRPCRSLRNRPGQLGRFRRRRRGGAALRAPDRDRLHPAATPREPSRSRPRPAGSYVLQAEVPGLAVRRQAVSGARRRRHGSGAEARPRLRQRGDHGHREPGQRRGIGGCPSRST
jgi:hypothetical protein